MAHLEIPPRRVSAEISRALLCYTLLTSILTEGTFRCCAVCFLEVLGSDCIIPGRFSLWKLQKVYQVELKYFIYAVFQLHFTLTQWDLHRCFQHCSNLCLPLFWHQDFSFRCRSCSHSPSFSCLFSFFLESSKCWKSSGTTELESAHFWIVINIKTLVVTSCWFFFIIFFNLSQ